MACWWRLLLGLWAVTPAQAGHERLNVCVKTPPHKGRPGPEAQLHEECLPWQGNACCTANTSWEAHLDVSPLRNFSLSHCGLMTPRCQKHFIQATCLYECSPNLGPWTQPVDRSGPGEHIVAVPLCREDCEQWWTDCRTSSTCKASWQEGWDLSQGRSRCPAGASCRPFPHHFPTAADLCGKVWGHLFKASPERRGSGRCVQKSFDTARGNPNMAVARLFASPAPSWGLSSPLVTASLLLSLHC
ncbi:sperm-egg fusion protein Juno [Dasypus novemcinctus]|uniref:sperm-egg fusion protein Juno n=1 Tax=Dasypus novemcinctus TaxID=9361 RepID=UPI00265FF2A1|nr:sperm-egg fusion protein Juno [Dasypus novemcinctus]